jgi:type IV secretion system protein VirB10
VQQRADSTVATARPSTFDSPYSQPVPIERDDARDARLEAFRAGLVAPVRAGTSESIDSEGSEAAAVGAPAIESHSPGATLPIGQLAESATPDKTNSTVVRPTSEATSETRVSVDSASLPFVVQAGTLVPAVLITEINSDLPGQVLAQVARDVYDTRSQRTILIPRGAKLIGTYEDQVPVGRDRLLVAWTRVLFPDGRSISLPGLQTKDRAGAGGVSDRVDRHMRRTFGTTALLSLIGAGLQLSQPRGAIVGGGYYPSAGQVAAAAVGQQLAEVAAQLLKREHDARPTIRIRQGLAFNVFLNTDLVFEQPHDPSP